MEGKNGNEFNWLERRIAEFVCLPALIFDWFNCFWCCLVESKQLVASWRFANYMSADLMEYMQEKGWYK